MTVHIRKIYDRRNVKANRDGRGGGGIIGNTDRMVGGERGTGMGLEGRGGEKGTGLREVMVVRGELG